MLISYIPFEVVEHTTIGGFLLRAQDGALFRRHLYTVGCLVVATTTTAATTVTNSIILRRINDGETDHNALHCTVPHERPQNT